MQENGLHPNQRRIEQWLMGLPITHNMAMMLRFPSSSSSNVHLIQQVSKCPRDQNHLGHGSEVIKCLLPEVYEAVSKMSKRKLRNLYVYASTYMHSSSLYIGDTALRVKVRESLGHLGQWRRKVLIINELSVSKKCPRRGFASWTSWTVPLVQDQCSSQSGTHGKPRHAHGILPNVKILSPLAGFSK